jgi:hypothetical protein
VHLQSDTFFFFFGHQRGAVGWPDGKRKAGWENCWIDTFPGQFFFILMGREATATVVDYGCSPRRFETKTMLFAYAPQYSFLLECVIFAVAG